MGKAYWGKQMLGGCPGLTHTIDKIMNIPEIKSAINNKNNSWIEPFMGKARTYKYLDQMFVIAYNDLSKYCYDYAKSNVIDNMCVTLTNYDYKIFMERHSSMSGDIWFFDPPFHFDLYNENKKMVCTEKPKEYLDYIFEFIKHKKLEKVIICFKHNNGYFKKLSEKYGFGIKEISSDNYPIFGKKARVDVSSNLFY